MMLRAKLLLLWLLALAIPVQGFAAVLQACAPSLQQAVQHHAPAVQAHQMQHEHHEQQAHQGHHADHGAATQITSADASDTQHQQHHTHSSCSFCAACTVGGLLPLALSTPPAPDLPSREFIALPASGFVGYLPENPDRPPALA
ncbi:hypothetical protein [Herbaspirillum huttiense]|uniref:hypothetical protein n=1 Tax=Herbaspirillum huttiense TaxID=863372 RepID=UPI002E782473|nr:hypothetical protein [Herbaspirillum huttiense]MEE1639064.1 hypothetical protein [Herbaspirillum huttiense NC40101]